MQLELLHHNFVTVATRDKYLHAVPFFPGYRYAMMSMKTVLATLLRRFRVLPVSKLDLGKPLDLKFDIMLRAADDFQVILETRT